MNGIGEVVDVWGLIFWLAGQSGFEPWSFTLHELVLLNNAADFQAWTIAAHRECVLRELKRDPKKRKRPFEWFEFHPAIAPLIAADAEEMAAKRPKTDIRILKAVFVDRESFGEVVEQFDLE